MTLCFIFFLRIMFFLQIILDSDQGILVSINFFQLTVKSLSVFDMGLKVREIFLDISKSFGKVWHDGKAWHDGLIFKLCENGVFGEKIDLLEGFLNNRKQRVA